MNQRVLLIVSIAIMLALFLLKIVFNFPVHQLTIYCTFGVINVGNLALLRYRNKQQNVWYARFPLAWYVAMLGILLFRLIIDTAFALMRKDAEPILDIATVLIGGLLFFTFIATTVTQHVKREQQTQQSSN